MIGLWAWSDVTGTLTVGRRLFGIYCETEWAEWATLQ